MRRDHVLLLYSPARAKDDIGARPKSSPTGEDRLVAAIFGISVDEDGIRVVLLFAVEVRPCFDVVVVCFGAISVGHGRRSRLHLANGAGRQGSQRGRQSHDQKLTHCPAPFLRGSTIHKLPFSQIVPSSRCRRSWGPIYAGDRGSPPKSGPGAKARGTDSGD